MGSGLIVQSWWPAIRAILITIALTVHLVYAAPVPKKIDAEDLATDGGREDMDRWMAIFATVGLHPERAGFEQSVVGVSEKLDAGVKALRAPMKPFLDFTGTGQSWGFFAYTTTRHGRLHVDVKTDGEWHTVYRRLDPEQDWRASMFRYRRVRAIYDTPVGRSKKLKSHYRSFSRWLARERFAEDPDAEALRMHIEYVTRPIPPDHVDPDPEFKHERHHKRENHTP